MIRSRVAAGNLDDRSKRLKLQKPDLYRGRLEDETTRLGFIYANLLKDRYLEVSNAQKAKAVEVLKERVGRVVRDEPHRLAELP